MQETTHRWNQEWKNACDKFQDLEEERIDFLKSNLWTYANIMSTVCVSDDETCEKIRVNLEKCEVDEVIQSFVQAKGTGQEIPGNPPSATSSPFCALRFCWRILIFQTLQGTRTSIGRRKPMMMRDTKSLNSPETVTPNSVPQPPNSPPQTMNQPLCDP